MKESNLGKKIIQTFGATVIAGATLCSLACSGITIKETPQFSVKSMGRGIYSINIDLFHTGSHNASTNSFQYYLDEEFQNSYPEVFHTEPEFHAGVSARTGDYDLTAMEFNVYSPEGFSLPEDIATTVSKGIHNIKIDYVKEKTAKK